MRTIGLLDWFRTERRSQEQTLDGSQLDTALRAALGGSAVTVRSVLNIPAVSGSVGFIAGTVASLPIRLYSALTVDGGMSAITINSEDAAVVGTVTIS